MTALRTHQPRGFVLNYRPGEQTRCPGCGHSNWIVGG